jgi:pyruvate/2-oxoglutarate dehydrogenase complex dihydrolipoamide dehydrogenase (E3) component
MGTQEVVASAALINGTEPEEYDLVILGDGTGSTLAAWTFAGEGKRVAVVERKYIGGSCPNIACLPSKNIIHSAKVAAYVRESEEFGITTGEFSIDMAAVRGRKRRMVASLNAMYLDNYKKTGAEIILATVIVSTGTRAALDAIPGLVEAHPLTHIETLELGEVPEHLLVIGGGYIGLELSQAMRRFGSKVSLIERSEQLVSREDDDVSEALTGAFRDEGIEIFLNAKLKRVTGKSGNAVQIVIEQNGVEKTLKGSHLLVATGRKPNTEGIGLELAGIEVTERGYIKVNERLQTTAPGVWAIGEVAGSPQFTHISVDDYRVVHDNLSGAGTRVTTGRQVPFCLFTDPEFARIGLSEKEAKAQGVSYRLFKVPMEAVLRARTLGETLGFMKALVESDGERVLGFTAVGVGAGETLATVQIAMIAGSPYTALRDAVLTHPTLAEGLGVLFASEPAAQNQRTRAAKQ